jgi:hypothetical protein
MLAHNTLASRMIIDQLRPLLPKDNEEGNVQVKRLQAMLDAITLADPGGGGAKSRPEPMLEPMQGLSQQRHSPRRACDQIVNRHQGRDYDDRE